MAKGNILLGQMRGTLGDLQLKHVNGETVISVKPVSRKKKEYTVAERKQQMAFKMSTQYYQMFKPYILDKWEGYKQATRIQSAFQKSVCREIKSYFAADKREKRPFYDQISRYSPKDCSAMVPTVCTITKGSLLSTPYSFDSESTCFMPAAAGDNVRLIDYMTYYDLRLGDTFTAFYIVNSNEVNWTIDSQLPDLVYESNIQVYSFSVKRDLSRFLYHDVNGLTFGNVFDFDIEDNNAFAHTQPFLSAIRLSTFTLSEPWDWSGAMALCKTRPPVGRKRKYLHSSALFHLKNKYKFGVDWDTALESYNGYKVIIETSV